MKRGGTSWLRTSRRIRSAARRVAQPYHLRHRGGMAKLATIAENRDCLRQIWGGWVQSSQTRAELQRNVLGFAMGYRLLDGPVPRDWPARFNARKNVRKNSRRQRLSYTQT